MQKLSAAIWPCLAQAGPAEARHLAPAGLLPLLEHGEVPLGAVRLLLRALSECGVLKPGWDQAAQRIQSAMQVGGFTGPTLRGVLRWLVC